MSALAYHVLDWGLLRIMTLGESEYIHGSPLMDAWSQRGMAVAPYYCCPVTGVCVVRAARVGMKS